MHMEQYITITSQGQMSIPMAIRKKMGWEKNKKISVELQGDKVVLSTIPDVMDLYGVFKTKKRISWKKIRRTLDTAWAQGKI